MTNKEQKFNDIESRALEKVWKAQSLLDIAKRVNSNCGHTQYNPQCNHLLDLNARGTHLQDPVYQKLARNLYKQDSQWAFNQYIIDALCRIGNRTMTEEEYHLIGEVNEKDLVDWNLDHRLRSLKEELNKLRRHNGGVTWAVGPFYCHRTPRNEKDLSHEAQKLGYFR